MISNPAVAAPLGRRAGAYAIDAVIAGLITALAMGVGAVFIALGGSPSDPVTLAWGLLLAYLFASAVALAWAAVYTAMQAGTGSIGQRLLHVALADAATGERIGFWRALLRNIVWAAACSIVVGYFTPLFDGTGRGRGWHDLASGAVVVDRTAASVAPASVPGAPSASTAPHVPSNPFLAAPAPSGEAPTQTDPFFAALRAGGAMPAAPAVHPAPVVPSAPAPNPFLAPATTHPAPTGTTFPTVPAASAADLTHTDPLLDAASAPPVAPIPVVPAPAPVLPVATSGMISSVPGRASAAPAPVVPAAQVPASAPSAYAPAALASVLVAAPDEDLDATRAHPAPAPTRLALVWDDGTRSAIYARTVFGRNPAADGATTIAVRDETLSLSKTHFEVDVDDAGTWIIDRHSTNGTVLHRAGGANPLTPGERIRLAAGDRVEIGDRSLTVEAVA